MNGEPWDLAIIGAGPVGLEAAARARENGLRTVVLEADRVGAHVRSWGCVRLFTPFGYNTGPAGARLARPDADAADMMTGHEFRERYLLPLADALRDAVMIEEGARVLA
ncbi:MAG: FAD-dependent oxidoreductase, partial [Gemmatimonadetes bacterium]|nr:FAD-dependent oxidoreductase [Gemmatimonadota bacterium]